MKVTRVIIISNMSIHRLYAIPLLSFPFPLPRPFFFSCFSLLLLILLIFFVVYVLWTMFFEASIFEDVSKKGNLFPKIVIHCLLLPTYLPYLPTYVPTF